MNTTLSFRILCLDAWHPSYLRWKWGLKMKVRLNLEVEQRTVSRVSKRKLSRNWAISVNKQGAVQHWGPLETWFLKFIVHQSHLLSIWKYRLLGPTCRHSDLRDLGWDLRRCISNKHPGNVDAAGLGTTLWVPPRQLFSTRLQFIPPGKLLNIPTSRLHPRPIKSESRGGTQSSVFFFKAPKMNTMCSQGWKLLL